MGILVCRRFRLVLYQWRKAILFSCFYEKQCSNIKWLLPHKGQQKKDKFLFSQLGFTSESPFEWVGLVAKPLKEGQDVICPHFSERLFAKWSFYCISKWIQCQISLCHMTEQPPLLPTPGTATFTSKDFLQCFGFFFPRRDFTGHLLQAGFRL